MIVILRIIFVAAAILSVGCAEQAAPGNGNAAGNGSDTTMVDTSAVTADSGRTEGEGAGDTTRWSTGAVERERSVSEIAVVDELRTGDHELYDRFVVEFQGNVIPSYHVAYLTDDTFECGSGRDVDLAGDAVLELRLYPARGHNEQGQPTVDHGERTYNMPVLKEAEVTCDFEAVFTVALGLLEERPFRIMELQDPPRLVLDVRKTTNE